MVDALSAVPDATPAVPALSVVAPHALAVEGGAHATHRGGASTRRRSPGTGRETYPPDVPSRRVGPWRGVNTRPPEPEERDRRCGPGGRRGGVLVIARDEAVRAVLVASLEEEGYAALGASDSVSGLLRAAARAPELVLLDLRAAGPAGQTFADRYRCQPAPRAPLILLSAGGLPELVDAAEGLGAAGFLRLPYELDDLLALVARFVRPVAVSPPRDGGAMAPLPRGVPRRGRRGRRGRRVLAPPGESGP